MLLADDDILHGPLGSRSVKAATMTLRSVGDQPFGTSMPSVTTTPPCRVSMTPCRRSLTTMTPTTTLTPCRHLLTTAMPRSTMSRAKTMPPSAMTQCSSTTGFDLLSEKIHAVHRAINPENNSDSDGDEELTDDQRATKSALALKKLGNMSRRKLDVNATTYIMIVENLLLKKKLGKSRKKSLSKQQKKEVDI